jgi:hypothetical protein
MKIYVDKYSPSKLTSKFHLLEDYYKYSKSTTEIMSPEGLYEVNSKTFLKTDTQDGAIKHIPNFYNGSNLILDYSQVKKTSQLSQIPYDHISKNVTSFYYCNGPDSKLYLVINGEYKKSGITMETKYNNLKDRYYQFTPTDFYFLAEEDFDNFFIKQELNVFLSLLN